MIRRINPEVTKRLAKLDVNVGDAIGYLLRLYYNVDDSGVSDEIKDIVRVSGIINRSYSQDMGTQVEFVIPLTNEKLTSKKLFDPDWLKAWVKLWPPPSVTGLDRSISGNRLECKNRMTRFFKTIKDRFDDLDYKNIDWEKRITEATQLYLNERQSLPNGWFFAKKNSKFIYDENGSYLEEYLRRILVAGNTGGSMLDPFKTQV